MAMKANRPVRDNQLCDPERWVDQHGDCLYSYALRRLRDRGVAEDLVQETFLAALQAREKFAGHSSERTWLIGILKHKIVDHFRRTSRESPLDDPESLAYEREDAFNSAGEWVDHWKEGQGPTEWGTDPGTVLEQKEFWEILDRGLSTLPARLAQVFMLREMEGLSTEEICKTLNISTSNLWVMLHRARMHLRRYLEINYFGQPNEKGQRTESGFSPHRGALEIPSLGGDLKMARI
jgi:RNA polymerase sigma-70 factor (ECF subfamily)